MERLAAGDRKWGPVVGGRERSLEDVDQRGDSPAADRSRKNRLDDGKRSVEDGLHTQARPRRRQTKGQMGRMRQLRKPQRRWRQLLKRGRCNSPESTCLDGDETSMAWMCDWCEDGLSERQDDSERNGRAPLDQATFHLGGSRLHAEGRIVPTAESGVRVSPLTKTMGKPPRWCHEVIQSEGQGPRKGGDTDTGAPSKRTQPLEGDQGRGGAPAHFGRGVWPFWAGDDLCGWHLHFRSKRGGWCSAAAVSADLGHIRGRVGVVQPSEVFGDGDIKRKERRDRQRRMAHHAGVIHQRPHPKTGRGGQGKENSDIKRSSVNGGWQLPSYSRESEEVPEGCGWSFVASHANTTWHHVHSGQNGCQCDEGHEEGDGDSSTALGLPEENMWRRIEVWGVGWRRANHPSFHRCVICTRRRRVSWCIFGDGEPLPPVLAVRKAGISDPIYMKGPTVRIWKNKWTQIEYANFVRRGVF